MPWPTELSDGFHIPCAEFARGSAEVLTPEVEDALRRLTIPYNQELETLTQGNAQLEAILGGFLIKAANYAANARQRKLEGF